MAKSQNPNDAFRGASQQSLQWAQSLHKTINGNITMGTPTGKDSTGQFNTFEPDNMNGVLIRVGAAGSTEKYKWTAANAAISINHGLARQPIGAFLVSSNKALTIYQPTTPDATTIHIAPTDQTVNATIYIF